MTGSDVTATNETTTTSEQATYDYARRAQGYTGTFADWQAMSADERVEYETGAAGIGTE